MVEKLTTVVLLSFVGGFLLLLSGLFSIFSGSLSVIFIFGPSLILLYFMLFASIAIVGIGFMLNQNPKNARILGLVTLIFGFILLIINWRSVSFMATPAFFGGSLTAILGLMAVAGGVLSIIGGALTIYWTPQFQPPVLDE